MLGGLLKKYIYITKCEILQSSMQSKQMPNVLESMMEEIENLFVFCWDSLCIVNGSVWTIK